MAVKAIGSVSNYRVAADPSKMVMDVNVSTVNGNTMNTEYESSINTANSSLLLALKSFVRDYAEEELDQSFDLLDSVRVFGPFEILT